MTRTLTEMPSADKGIASSRAGSAGVQVAIALKAVLLFALALNTQFVMDEFWQLGQAKYLGDGFFTTIWPAKAVGYAIFYKVAHLIGWDAKSTLLIGRAQTMLIGYGTILMVYAITRAMGESRARALVIVLVLLCFSTFAERIFRTRSEPLALFFATGALLAVLSGPDSWRRLLLAGGLSGLAFLSTQKSVYFNVALGGALVTEAVVVGGRVLPALRRSGLLVAGWAVPVLLYCFAFGGTDPRPIAANLFLGPVEVATTGADYYSGLRHFVVQTLVRNLPLYLVFLAGFALSLRTYRALSEARRIALVFTAVIAALVFAHDQPWPYVFIMAIPFLALWATAGADAIGGSRERRTLLVAAFVVVVAFSFVKNVRYLAHDNAAQLAVIARAESMLSADQTYFDGIGMLPTRRDRPHVWLDAKRVYQALKGGAASELSRALNETPPDLIIRSYRTDALGPVLRPFLESRYIDLARNLMVPGRRLPPGETVVFDAPLAREYGLYDSAGAPVREEIDVDGEMRAFPAALSAGHHRIAGAAGRPLFILPSGLSPDDLDRPMPPMPLFEDVYGF